MLFNTLDLNFPLTVEKQAQRQVIFYIFTYSLFMVGAVNSSSSVCRLIC
jgi:hypothetical protein